MGAGSLRISFDFNAKFSNILSVSVVTEKINEKSIEEFHLNLYTVAVSTNATSHFICSCCLVFYRFSFEAHQRASLIV